MSLRWTSYVAAKPPKSRGSKTLNGHFPCIITLCLKKVCYKGSFCENCQRQSCKAFIGLTIRDPFYLNFWIKVTALERNRRFTIYFSAVTPSGKSSINTNMNSTTHFPMSPRWTSYVVPKPPKGALKNAVSKIWTLSCDNSETVRDRILVTVNH